MTCYDYAAFERERDATERKWLAEFRDAQSRCKTPEQTEQCKRAWFLRIAQLQDVVAQRHGLPPTIWKAP